MTGARTPETMSPGLLRVMERARRDPNERQFSLVYLIDVEALRRAYGRIRKDAAVGVDGVTKEQYGQDLEMNLTNLHKRMKAMKYRHQPIRRVHIPKDKSRKRKGPGWHVASKTRKARLTRAVQNAYDFCRRQRHKPIAVQHKALVSRIRGHLVYFGVNDNGKSLSAFVYWATRAWHKWLNRRSQRARLNWERFQDLLKDYPLPQPKVYVNLWASP